jgi:hypothetical protein
MKKGRLPHTFGTAYQHSVVLDGDGRFAAAASVSIDVLAL